MYEGIVVGGIGALIIPIYAGLLLRDQCAVAILIAGKHAYCCRGIYRAEVPELVCRSVYPFPRRILGIYRGCVLGYRNRAIAWRWATGCLLAHDYGWAVANRARQYYVNGVVAKERKNGYRYYSYNEYDGCVNGWLFHKLHLASGFYNIVGLVSSPGRTLSDVFNSLCISADIQLLCLVCPQFQVFIKM
jgi:hypothetical protein